MQELTDFIEDRRVFLIQEKTTLPQNSDSKNFDIGRYMIDVEDEKNKKLKCMTIVK